VTVSKQYGERQANIRSRFDEEPMSPDELHPAEQLFAKLGMRALVGNTSIPDSAGPRLPRCNGRALTPQEAGPAQSEREQDDEHSQRNSTT